MQAHTDTHTVPRECLRAPATCRVITQPGGCCLPSHPHFQGILAQREPHGFCAHRQSSSHMEDLLAAAVP